MSSSRKPKGGANHGGGGGGHDAGGGMRWLLTYSDMITLLMVFFIVLYAMSEVDKGKYAALANSLRQAFGGGNLIVSTGTGVGDGVSVPMPADLVPPVNPSDAGTAGEAQGTGQGEGASRDPLENIGLGLYADFARDGRFTAWISERGLTISLAGNAFFDSGKADIKPEMRPLLDEIARRLQGVTNDISVEGFADSDPIHTPEFPSNWYLSAARANQVRDYLESRGIPGERMIAVSYGETRPVFSNATEEGKAKNRRVDVVILRDRVKVDLGQEIGAKQP